MRQATRCECSLLILVQTMRLITTDNAYYTQICDPTHMSSTSLPRKQRRRDAVLCRAVLCIRVELSPPPHWLVYSALECAFYLRPFTQMMRALSATIVICGRQFASRTVGIEACCANCKGEQHKQLPPPPVFIAYHGYLRTGIPNARANPKSASLSSPSRFMRRF